MTIKLKQCLEAMLIFLSNNCNRTSSFERTRRSGLARKELILAPPMGTRFTRVALKGGLLYRYSFLPLRFVDLKETLYYKEQSTQFVTEDNGRHLHTTIQVLYRVSLMMRSLLVNFENRKRQEAQHVLQGETSLFSCVYKMFSPVHSIFLGVLQMFYNTSFPK